MFLAIFESLFSISQNIEPTRANFTCFWANFHCYDRLNIEQIIEASGHTELINSANTIRTVKEAVIKRLNMYSKRFSLGKQC